MYLLYFLLNSIRRTQESREGGKAPAGNWPGDYLVRALDDIIVNVQEANLFYVGVSCYGDEDFLQVPYFNKQRNVEPARHAGGEHHGNVHLLEAFEVIKYYVAFRYFSADFLYKNKAFGVCF